MKKNGKIITLNYENMEAYEAELELYFQKKERNNEAARIANLHISQMLSHALPLQDIDSCLALIPYIKSGDGLWAYKYSAEVQRIFVILHIIEFEYKNSKTLFCSTCIDQDSLLEKYMLSLFAFRRLIFQLSATSVEEAVCYLSRIDLSIFAVYFIIQNDLIIPNNALYEKIIQIYTKTGTWSNDDIFQLLSLIAHSIVLS